MVEYDNLKINLDNKECYIDDSRVKLTKTEFILLTFFLENKDKIYNRKEIANILNKPNISLRAVDTIISRLRKKLKDYGKHISTRVGFGYGFKTLP